MLQPSFMIPQIFFWDLINWFLSFSCQFLHSPPRLSALATVHSLAYPRSLPRTPAHSLAYPRSLPLTPAHADAWISTGIWQKPEHILSTYIIPYFSDLSWFFRFCTEATTQYQCTEWVLPTKYHIHLGTDWPRVGKQREAEVLSNCQRRELAQGEPGLSTHILSWVDRYCVWSWMTLTISVVKVNSWVIWAYIYSLIRRHTCVISDGAIQVLKRV